MNLLFKTKTTIVQPADSNLIKKGSNIYIYICIQSIIVADSSFEFEFEFLVIYVFCLRWIHVEADYLNYCLDLQDTNAYWKTVRQLFSSSKYIRRFVLQFSYFYIHKLKSRWTRQHIVLRQIEIKVIVSFAVKSIRLDSFIYSLL